MHHSWVPAEVGSGGGIRFQERDVPLNDKADEVAGQLVRGSDLGTDVSVPDGAPLAEALRRTTVLGVGAHPDDLEIGMTAGVLSCIGRSDRWFTGVTCTDGAGGPQLDGAVMEATELIAVRRNEQRLAARVGCYGAQIQFGYSSANARSPEGRSVLAHRLADLVEACSPEVVFTHSLADRHATHVSIALAVVDACRLVPANQRPRHIVGVEIWGSLAWLAKEDRVGLSVDDPTDVAPSLIRSFTSQVATKPYAEAARGRWIANATFDESHSLPTNHGTAFAMDLSRLVATPDLDARAFLRGLMARSNYAMEALVVQMTATDPAPSGSWARPGAPRHQS